MLAVLKIVGIIFVLLLIISLFVPDQPDKPKPPELMRIARDVVNIRTGPGTDFDVDGRGQLAWGDSIYVTGGKDDWLEFVLDAGDTLWSGWIRSDLVVEPRDWSKTVKQKQVKATATPPAAQARDGQSTELRDRIGDLRFRDGSPVPAAVGERFAAFDIVAASVSPLGNGFRLEIETSGPSGLEDGGPGSGYCIEIDTDGDGISDRIVCVSWLERTWAGMALCNRGSQALSGATSVRAMAVRVDVEDEDARFLSIAGRGFRWRAVATVQLSEKDQITDAFPGATAWARFGR